MSEAGAAPVADRVAAARARTDGFSVPLDPEAYTGPRGPALDALTEELESLSGDVAGAQGAETTAAAVAARLGRCRAVRFVLEGAPADRERALPLLTEARTCALLGNGDREPRTGTSWRWSARGSYGSTTKPWAALRTRGPSTGSCPSSRSVPRSPRAARAWWRTAACSSGCCWT
ncbi:hypothetical protein [Streptomyces sp. NPDC005890]|uniref:hypothetical protein n=1 Tax=Streptomyces sp. NPDC005890 TaxID=3154568 RepID=UPI0033E654DA